jgi:hypothetical protein
MADSPYKLHVKLGANEFTAEGPEQEVRDAYQAFLDAITAPVKAAAAAPVGDGTAAVTPPPPGTTLDREFLERVYQVDPRGIVSLRVLPPDSTNREADAAILLLYGFRVLQGQREVLVTRLNEGLRQSGINVERLDRFMGVHGSLFMRGGSRSGGRYNLNNVGMTTAENWLRTRYE